MVVTVRLLGGLEARAGERAAPAPAHPQGAALLAWLALHPGEHDRGPLAALLWPDRGATAARAELRRAAWSLRRALAPHDRAVLDGRTTLGLRCTTDVEQFDAYVAAGDGAAALALCRRGPLLAGLEEHEWVLAARAEFARRVAALRAAAAREHGGSRGPCGGRPTP